jgi:hypothetical protein
MRSVYNGPAFKTNIFDTIVKVKGEIDTIRELKNLDDDHDLSLASNYLDSFLDSIERQNTSLNERS